MRGAGRLWIALIVVALLVTACDGDTAGCDSIEPGDPEPFALNYYMAGAEYAVVVEITGDQHSADSCGLDVTTGVVRSHEWRPADSPQIGEEIEFTVRDTVVLASGDSVIVVVDGLDMDDGVTRYTLLVLDENWFPVPGNIASAVEELEVAASATAISDRRGAVIAVLDELAR